MVAADTASFPSTVTGILEVAMGTQAEAASNQGKGWICNYFAALLCCPVHTDSFVAQPLFPCLISEQNYVPLLTGIFFSESYLPTTACTMSTADPSNGATYQSIRKVGPLRDVRLQKARDWALASPVCISRL